MNAAACSKFSARQLAVGLAGYCAFINLYSPQSILPLLSQDFGAGVAQVSTIITVSTLAVAITAPAGGGNSPEVYYHGSTQQKRLSQGEADCRNQGKVCRQKKLSNRQGCGGTTGTFP